MSANIAIALTANQAQAVIDALDLYTEGAQGQQTLAELRSADQARNKLYAAVRAQAQTRPGRT